MHTTLQTRIEYSLFCFSQKINDLSDFESFDVQTQLFEPAGIREEVFGIFLAFLKSHYKGAHSELISN